MKYAFLVLATGICQAAVAQNNSTSTAAGRLAEETAALNAQAARDNAAAAATNAATARVKAQTDALGIPKVEGKTTVGTNGGVLESWMLSSYAVDASGREIAGNVVSALNSWAGATTPVPPSQRRILLISGDESLSLDTAANVAAQIALVDRNIMLAAPGVCPASVSMTAAFGAALPFIGAVANLLKTDTEITGLDFTVPPRMLAAATGKYLRTSHSVVIPTAAVATSSGSPTAVAWDKLLKSRNVARSCLPATPDDKLPDAVKPKVKALREAIASADDLESKLLKPDDKGNTLLGQAVRVDALVVGDPYVLRVTVEKGGGSMLKRSNVWTALGAPAVAITGGLVSNYWLTDPRTGELILSGNVVCRTAMTNLRDVQTDKVKLPDSHSLCKSNF
jgi:hypothetical protein